MQPPQAAKLKQEMRQQFGEAFAAKLSGSEAEELLRKAESKLSFLRMTTVKKRSQGGRRRWVQNEDGSMQEEGQNSERDKAKWTNWDGKNVDPEAIQRHYHGLRRMGFVNNAHAKGPYGIF